MRIPLVIAVSVLAASSFAAERVGVEWRLYDYRGPSYRWGCVDALMGVETILSLIQARQVKAYCSGNYGLQARWEALAPSRVQAGRERVSAFISEQGRQGAFPGILSSWENARDTPLKAHWRRGALQYNLSSIRACTIFTELLDNLLPDLPVRNVNQTVFCNTGTGTVYLSLEYLALDEAGKR